MKKFLATLALTSLSLGFSSCCSMFGKSSAIQAPETPALATTAPVEPIAYDSKSSKDGLAEALPALPPVLVKTEKAKCTRRYCAEKDFCGTTSESTIKMATSQGPVGSPHIGLIPTMRKLAQ